LNTRMGNAAKYFPRKKAAKIRFYNGDSLTKPNFNFGEPDILRETKGMIPYQLPTEILLHIFGCLTVGDLHQVMLVCKFWRTLILDMCARWKPSFQKFKVWRPVIMLEQLKDENNSKFITDLLLNEKFLIVRLGSSKQELLEQFFQINPIPSDSPISIGYSSGIHAAHGNSMLQWIGKEKRPPGVTLIEDKVVKEYVTLLRDLGHMLLSHISKALDFTHETPLSDYSDNGLLSALRYYRYEQGTRDQYVHPGLFTFMLGGLDTYGGVVLRVADTILPLRTLTNYTNDIVVVCGATLARVTENRFTAAHQNVFGIAKQIHYEMRANISQSYKNFLAPLLDSDPLCLVM